MSNTETVTGNRAKIFNFGLPADMLGPFFEAKSAMQAGELKTISDADVMRNLIRLGLKKFAQDRNNSLKK